MALSMRDILATLDSIECDVHLQYKRIETLRHQLRAQWDVKNAPGYWPYESAKADDAVARGSASQVEPDTRA